jgi:RimJ/RimL family protein N-acetyltransferase
LKRFEEKQKVLDTERLLLRPWLERDREPFAAIVGDPHVMRFYTATRDRAASDAWIDKMIAGLSEGSSAFLAAERKSDGALLGLIGTGRIDMPLRGNPPEEIGWVLGHPYWGQGYAPEGAGAHIAHAWQRGLPEIVAFTAAINTPSQRVMEKLGMTRDPQGDFLHPRIEEHHRLRPHVLYRRANPHRS